MASSPAPSNGGEPRQEEVKQIAFRFCRECSNMLYPKEDRANDTLMFACRTCQFSEPATSACVFRNRLETSVGDTAGVTQDVGSDPTSQQRSAETGMKLYYVCCSCGNVFT
ncbi:MAG: hypothetical protein M1834_002099 [Cirrosporium novae-zelandiae]|nr:MAG: hypothetical protein M1834_002099 [Cirrosporium novae-zelandiae]